MSNDKLLKYGFITEGSECQGNTALLSDGGLTSHEHAGINSTLLGRLITWFAQIYN